MRLFIKQMMDKVRTDFTLLDLGLLKVYGALFGLVVGAFFPDFVLRYLPVLIGVFTVLLIRFLYLLWRKPDRKKAGLPV